MKQVFLVFAGSGAGGVLRYLVAKVMSSPGGLSFPWATLTVNTAAGLFIGLLIGWGHSQKIISPSVSLLLATGFCGGLSTFSTFSAESVHLMERGQYLQLAAYILVSVVGSIGATFAGLYLAK